MAYSSPPEYSLDDYVQDAARLSQRISLSRRATDLPASAQFDLARSNLSDAELLSITAEFGRDTSASGWGLAPVLDHLLSREPDRFPVADLRQLQANLKRQGYLDSDYEPTGTWDPTSSTAFYRFDQDNRSTQMGGSSWGAAPVRAGLELLTNTIPTRVFQGLIGGAKGFVEQSPETAERVGLLGGAGVGAALGAAAGTVFAPLTLGASIGVGAAIGGAVGFLADLFTSDEKEGDQSMAASFVDALSPYEEYVATRDGIKAFWEDVGWTLTAASLIGGAGLATKAVVGTAATASEFGAIGAQELRANLLAGATGQPGWFGRLTQSALGRLTGPEFSEAAIRATKIATTVGNKVYTPFSAASIGARYGGGFGSGETQTTIEKAIEEGPELPGWIDLTSFLIVPTQFFPFKLSQLGKAAESALGQTNLLPVIHAVQQTERVSFGEAEVKALDYLGKNEIERGLNFARLTVEAGLDTLAREKIAKLGMDGTESIIEHAFTSAKAKLSADLRPLPTGEAVLEAADLSKVVQGARNVLGSTDDRVAGIEAVVEALARKGQTVTAAKLREALEGSRFGLDGATIERIFRSVPETLTAEVISSVNGPNRAALEGWLVRNATSGSGPDRLSDFLEATRLGERATTDYRAASGTIEDQLRLKYKGLKLDLIERDDAIVLSRIEVPEAIRDQGIGTQAMEDLIRYADKRGKTIALTPTSDFGGSKTRLTEFYKRFGFRPNTGKAKDFAFRETMIREAQESGAAGLKERVPNTVEAWNRLEGLSEIKKIRAQAEELSKQAVRARNPEEMRTLQAAAKQLEEQAALRRQALPKVTAGGAGAEGAVIVPARLDTLTSPQLRSLAADYKRIRDEVVEAVKIGNGNWERDARMKLYDFVEGLKRRQILPERLASKVRQEKPTLGVVKHLEDRARYAAGEVTVPANVAADFERLGYKPVAVSGGFFQLDDAQRAAELLGAPVYSKVSRWVETLGLSPLKQNDDAIFDLMRANQQSEVQRVLEYVGPDRQAIEGLSGSEVLGKLQAEIAKDVGKSIAVGGTAIGKAPLMDVRQLSPDKILEVFQEDWPEFTLKHAEGIFKALKQGSAFGAEVKLLHPADAMRAVGRAMRVNGLPGFSDVVRAYQVPSKGKLVLGGAVVGAATGAVVGDDKIEDAAKGALIGGLTGLAGAMAAFSKNGYGYLPDRLARVHNALRYSLSPTFDAGRYLEQNAVAASRYGLRPIWKPRASITKEYGAEGWQEALSLWDEVNGTKGLIRNIDAMEQRMNTTGILAFSPRNFEAAQAYMLMKKTGMTGPELKEAVYGLGRYGLGRTGLEKSVNFVFFPFSYSKKMLGVAGDFVLQHAPIRLLLHEGMRRYYLGHYDEKVHDFLEDHVPLLQHLSRITNFGAYGLSPGAFFLEGLADRKSDVGKVVQVLSSAFVPSGAARTFAEAAGGLGDLAVHAFVPVVLTGNDFKRGGGFEPVKEIIDSYVPFMRDLTDFYDDASDQVTALTQGEGKWAQLTDYRDELRVAKGDLEELATALGYSSAEGLMAANPAYAAAYETTKRELASKYPSGFKEAQSFDNTEALNDQALFDLVNKPNRSKAEDLVLKLRALEGEGDALVELGLPRDLVDAMTAGTLRREALLHVRDREFAALWSRFFEWKFGPIQVAA